MFGFPFGCDVSISVFTEANEKSGFGLISAFSVIGISFVGHAPYTMADDRNTIFDSDC